MITAEQSKAFQKADLASVCEYNGEFMHVDGTPLSAKEEKQVAEIMAAKEAPKKHKK
jgi:hypothetical protein